MTAKAPVSLAARERLRDHQVAAANHFVIRSYNPEDLIEGELEEKSLFLENVDCDQHFEVRSRIKGRSLVGFGRFFKKLLGEDIEPVENELRSQGGIWRSVRHAFSEERLKFLICAVDQMCVAGSAGQSVPRWRRKMVELIAG